MVTGGKEEGRERGRERLNLGNIRSHSRPHREAVKVKDLLEKATPTDSSSPGPERERERERSLQSQLLLQVMAQGPPSIIQR